MSAPSCLVVNLTIANQSPCASAGSAPSSAGPRTGDRQRKLKGTTSPRHIRFSAASKRPPALNGLRQPSDRRPLNFYVLDLGSEDDEEEEIDLREALFTQSPPWTSRRARASDTASCRDASACRPPATPSTASTTRTLASSMMTLSTMATSTYSVASDAAGLAAIDGAKRGESSSSCGRETASQPEAASDPPLHSGRIQRSSGCLNLLALNQKHTQHRQSH